ncbi:hypothetical protein [Leisingera sp. JC1]|uniref:hypothetical protein n=1 Tax=Leisingera sp. JC1 TaxID=1855282 RepID=UPI0015863E17|nr:hypothetical protein [Leisingera sp. JC1]
MQYYHHVLEQVAVFRRETQEICFTSNACQDFPFSQSQRTMGLWLLSKAARLP